MMSNNREQLWQQLRSALAQCDAFRSDDALQALFADPRLRPWAQQVPAAPTVAARVDGLLAQLWSRRHASGEPAILRLLQASRDTVHPEDALHSKLASLAEAIGPLLEEGEAPPFLDEPPQEHSGDVIQQNVTISGQGRAGDISLTGKVQEANDQPGDDEEQQAKKKRWWQR